MTPDTTVAEIVRADEIAVIAEILASGTWRASVYHCPPAPKHRPKIWNAAVAMVVWYPTQAPAKSAAAEAVRIGRARTTWLHGPTSKPLTTFVLPTDGLKALGDIASAIEARRAETVQTGSVHESAVPQADAQTPVATQDDGSGGG